ncbi:unnamed protein product [Caenorhabditis angaria]|uniref:CSD domain-containing protein n=1 Tax=Caenorhabditis angaria TaxID=860376 RepID=A0A9P1MS59_9PELO|nr:unnamed protein product [Caenorhabditis angaria]
MSDEVNTSIEVAEEAIEKLENLKVSDGSKSPRRPRVSVEERVRLWEEEQKNKTVLKKGIEGTVKWYSVLGRYGFISRKDGEKDVFVHQKAIAASETNKFYLRTLGNDEEVVFDLVDGRKGPEAANVTGPNGENVHGSKFRHILFSSFRKNRQNTRKNQQSTEKADNSEVKSAESAKKPGKQRKTRERKNRAPKSPEPTTEEAKAGARREIINEAQTILTDRCGSALGEANLGAQIIDAQI